MTGAASYERLPLSSPHGWITDYGQLSTTDDARLPGGVSRRGVGLIGLVGFQLVFREVIAAH
ncbi:MAG TPA: hypothetical protein EYN90_04245 [Acidobacteria bacterium]|nr:hypothetical protein [Acidobacteriota bacterium]